MHEASYLFNLIKQGKSGLLIGKRDPKIISYAFKILLSCIGDVKRVH